MENIRKYGLPPYRIAVVHGGPGAQGGMAEVAAELSSTAGVIEPIQKERNIKNEIEELHGLIAAHGSLPVVLIGHSWGAWLSVLTAASYPGDVSKLILVSSAPFEEVYAESIHATRMKRLTPAERAELSSVLQVFSSGMTRAARDTADRLSTLTLKSDSYDLKEEPRRAGAETIDSAIFKSVWGEASELRRSGKLLVEAKKLACPVVAIHGDSDPHPADGVKIPLAKTVENFRFIMLERCGHYPWREKHAAEKFYDILKSELNLAIHR